ncbi:hypothetical protein ALI22I_00960 [Saccharothrix sp. ALI-22-I]|uniref:peptidase inhibitor family I36 protein n=1 Tax=Saccharothrix sp. ALI-22-I TaxID=1933778 RepID=UPI00097C6738|nr:peptidase inhibitor family I36 protein [Saccharothrix sp. ALI-22-I]ONI92950.1 hypothetical protein ALI22I_00960 [Saccharothrix sp. ALI-22-I]
MFTALKPRLAPALVTTGVAVALLLGGTSTGNAEPSGTGQAVVNTATTQPMEAAAAPKCPEDALCLWEHANFEGRRLVFRDEGYWQNLEDWAFNDQTSSYWNRRDDDAAFQWANSAKVCIESGSRSASMGVANDRLWKIYLAHTDNNC